MKRNQQGSSILITLLLLYALVVFSIAIWKRTTLSLDLVHTRLRYEQHVRATELVLNYGIALCKENASTLLKEGKNGVKELLFTCDDVPLRGEKQDKGIVTIKIHDSLFTLRAALVIAEKETCALRCDLCQDVASDHWRITHWGFDVVA